MFAIRLNKAFEERLANIAAAKGVDKRSVVLEALMRYVEDQEDVTLAERARKAGGKAKPIPVVRKMLGLDR